MKYVDLMAGIVIIVPYFTIIKVTPMIINGTSYFINALYEIWLSVFVLDML